MAIASAPPPLEVPGQFAKDKTMNAFFSALLNTIYQMWVALYASQTQSKITTTDGTATPMFRISVDNNTTVMIVADIAAHRTGGSAGHTNDSGFFQLIGAYKNNNGTMTGIGSPSSIAQSDQGTWATNFSFSGTNAVITVTGAAGNNITWQGTVTTQIAGA
jgi:hypothetical protein